MTNPTTTTTATNPLHPDRWEHDLHDKKPLLTAAEAKVEADRCLYCADAPCIKACPTSIDIPTFIKKIASGNVRGSARTILEQNLLGYSCARVCPVEVLCVGDCVLNAVDHKPIAIGRLQRYATEHGTAAGQAPLFVAKPRGSRRVALIGAGPASLACAGVLALNGVEATIFEKRGVAGGLNTTGIAPYKLRAEESLHEVDFVRSLGVEIRTGISLGEAAGPNTVTAESLLAEYDAVFLGLGLGVDNRLGIPGEDGPGVIGATAWIETMKLAPRDPRAKLGRVVIVGGGNTALDVAREAALLGADEVALVYRRGEADMTGYAHELEGARTETVRLLPHRTPVAFERDETGALTGLRVRVTDPNLGPNHDSREEVIPCELATIAIGQEKLGALAAAFPGLVLDAKGRVEVSPSTRRSAHPKVYAGGDCINGGKEVVNAVADGRDAAQAMLKELGDG